MAGENKDKTQRADTPLLVAAQKGIVEVVNKILERLPVSIHDISRKKKSIVLVAVENRQPRILDALETHVNEVLKKPQLWRHLVGSVDSDDNTILHLAANYYNYELQIEGSSALQMQHEIKWYEYVKSFSPPHFTFLANKKDETPEEIFLRNNRVLFLRSDEWLSHTSESCSVVAALVAGVAYATSTTVPGGNHDKTGKPTLEGRPGFDIFAISALIALCFSVTAIIMFLSIITSRKRPNDFRIKLPLKLFLALSSLFGSIVSMFISFCAGHSFVLEDKFKRSVLSLYVFICLPIFLTIVEFPLYKDLFKGFFMSV
ncbi:uncharacterized protein LOC114720633 [Neltuma alba]|uniref:uncharacterized protein LOC114720633 n=1 Tax=Neltuma alba TaxID=207710 RepID=UPI0010A4B8A9|nr:uncharacterized protein LOC114720633 [Prosopis alba]